MIIKLLPPHKTDKIVALIPRDTFIIRRIMGAFLSVLSTRAVQYKVSVHNISNNIQWVERCIKESLKDKNTKLIFSLGRDCTQIAKKVTLTPKNLLPIVFGGIVKQTMKDLFLLKSNQNTAITGITVDYPTYKQHIEYFLELIPQLKKILFLYSPQGIVVDYDAIKNTFHRLSVTHNIITRFMPIQTKDDLEYMLPDALKESDLVIMSRDHLLLAEIDTIVNLCNNYSVMLCASDLESVKYGATIGVGDFEQILGEKLAENAIEILQNNRHPGQISITHISCRYKLMINVAALAKQKFDFEMTLKRAIGLNALMFV